MQCSLLGVGYFFFFFFFFFFGGGGGGGAYMYFHIEIWFEKSLGWDTLTGMFLVHTKYYIVKLSKQRYKTQNKSCSHSLGKILQ